MLVGRGGHRAWQLRRCLAACIAVLLALAPLARPYLPVHLAAISSFPDALVARADLQEDQPAARLLPAQPAIPGILSRLLLVESTLGLPPVKPPLLRAVAAQPLLTRHADMVPGGERRAVLERSAVGTARTPTGPPA